MSTLSDIFDSDCKSVGILANDKSTTENESDQNKLTKADKKRHVKAFHKQKSVLQRIAKLEFDSTAESDIEKIQSTTPTQNIIIINGGVGCGVEPNQLKADLCRLLSFSEKDFKISATKAQAFCFIAFSNVEMAEKCTNELNDKQISSLNGRFLNCIYSKLNELKCLKGNLQTIAMNSIDGKGGFAVKDVPGLWLFPNFITEEEEEMLMKQIDEKQWHSMQFRDVQHYGFAFDYNSNCVDLNKPLTEEKPSFFDFTLNRVEEQIPKLVPFKCDQLTINSYEPGGQIPPHTDTHHAFADPILSLSLGSDVVMEMRLPPQHEEANELTGNTGQLSLHDSETTEKTVKTSDKSGNHVFRDKSSNATDSQQIVDTSASNAIVHVPVLLPKRSLLVMSGASRYIWTHSISKRTTDFVNGNILERKRRISLTFRKVLHQKICACPFVAYCPTQLLQLKTLRESVSNAAKQAEQPETIVEKRHVADVYDAIASHFSATRHKPWPKVAQFVLGVPKGGILGDVGCGNGRYMSVNADIVHVGVDRSIGLLEQCLNENGKKDVSLGTALCIPWKDNSCDAIISIAVIHHFSTVNRRKAAICECKRVLKKNGKMLLTVWAWEQEKFKNEPSQDLFVKWNFIDKSEKNNENDGKQFDRYYHLFKEGELRDLCGEIDDLAIVEQYYDSDNWCIVLQKTK